MTGWHQQRMAAFDIESGGVDVETDGIVTITVAMVGAGVEPDLWSGLVAVDFDIAPEATAVHGITTEHAREHGKPAADVLDEAAGRLAAALTSSTPVVGMNMPFDLTILDRNCRRYGVPPLSDRLGGAPIAPVVDVLVLDKALDRFRPGSRKLTDLCNHYSVKHGGAHDALEDALAAARIAYVIGRRSHLDFATLRGLYADRRFPDRIARDWQSFAALSLAELHDRQIGWYAEQASGLAAYWMSQAEQKRTEGDRDDPPGDEGLSPDERREVLRTEAAELADRAAGVTTEWPLRPLAVA